MAPSLALSLSELLFELRLRGADLVNEGGELRLDAPRGSLYPDEIVTLRSRKTEILRRIALAHSHGPTVIQQIADATRCHPERVALVEGSRRITYAELDRRVCTLAHTLRQAGCAAECRVGIWLPRGIDRIVSLLGAMKAGGAYVALGEDWPNERIASLVRSGELHMLIAPEARVGQLPVDALGALQWLDPVVLDTADVPDEPLEAILDPRQLAYVIFTSGSSGTPKGVQIEHRSLAALVNWHRAEYISNAADVRASHTASVAFDAHIWEIFPYLCAGACLYIASDHERSDPKRLSKWLCAEGITHCFLATPLAEALLQTADVQSLPLECLLVGGDVLKFSGNAALPFRVVNHYGPTETTVVATSAFVPIGETLPPIGLPICAVTAFVGEMPAVGARSGHTGELSLGGVAVARGYLNDPRLTAAKFLPDPDGEAGARRYNTGDVVQVTHDRQLRFLERSDAQLKIRGIRIEPAEVERRLLEDRRVAAAAVVKPNTSPDLLVAYCTPGEAACGDYDDTLVRDWRALYEKTYDTQAQNATSPTRATDTGSEFVGWLSSLDGAEIEVSEMNEWADATIRRICALAPRRLLEVGAGTGILAFRLLPGLDAYTGCDISDQAIKHLQQRLLCADTSLQSRAIFARAAAHELHMVPGEKWDTVVMNSTCQYFPSEDYLTDVLDAMMARVSSCGTLFVGDVRDFRLLSAFHAAVARARSTVMATASDVRELMWESMGREMELLVSPHFFETWAHHHSRVTQVLVMPKLTYSANEMTRFRYDVAVHLDTPCQAAASVAMHAWADENSSLRWLDDVLRSSELDAIDMAGIPLPMTMADLSWCRQLAVAADEDDIASFPGENTVSGAAPMNLIARCEEAGWRARALLNGQIEGTYLLQATRGKHWPRVPNFEHTVTRVCNQPRVARLSESLASELRGRLKATLPDYMVPARILFLDTLPLTENGKVDRHALSALSVPRVKCTVDAITHPIERLVAQWWSLALSTDNIGRDSNFFDLGGHSLLAMRMVGKIAETTSIEVPVHLVLEYPVLANFAERLIEFVGGDDVARQITQILEDETAGSN